MKGYSHSQLVLDALAVVQVGDHFIAEQFASPLEHGTARSGACTVERVATSAVVQIERDGQFRSGDNVGRSANGEVQLLLHNVMLHLWLRCAAGRKKSQWE